MPTRMITIGLKSDVLAKIKRTPNPTTGTKYDGIGGMGVIGAAGLAAGVPVVSIRVAAIDYLASDIYRNKVCGGKYKYQGN